MAQRVTDPLTPEALRATLDREGLRLREGEEAEVLRTARFLLDAARLVREALEAPC
jgi:hypothetical protein